VNTSPSGAKEPRFAANAAVAGCPSRTEGVTTTALAPRTRADTNAGLGTVGDVRLASRQTRERRACRLLASETVDAAVRPEDLALAFGTDQGRNCVRDALRTPSLSRRRNTAAAHMPESHKLLGPNAIRRGLGVPSISARDTQPRMRPTRSAARPATSMAVNGATSRKVSAVGAAGLRLRRWYGHRRIHRFTDSPC
jgi:hypothetical protein